MTKILVINGSYRENGITDQLIEAIVKRLEIAGAEVETILLRNYPIQFCLNCRDCTQQPGDHPGKCVLQDDMQNLISMIEESDGFILASPTNFGSVTAIFRRFMERLVAYAYWPWQMNAPKYRKAKVAKKKAVLISSCAAPGFLGRWLYSTSRQLKTTAKTIGADTVGVMVSGLSGTEPRQQISKRAQVKSAKLADMLL